MQSVIEQRFFWHTQGVVTLVTALVTCYLLIDFAYGAITLAGYAQVKLSLAYKGLILIFSLIYLILATPAVGVFCSVVLLVFMIPVVRHFLESGSLGALIYNLSFAVKFIAPIFIFFFWRAVSLHYQRFEVLTKVLWFLVASVVLNTLVAALDIGFHSYGSPESGFGNIGLIYAGNEYGGLLVLLSGYTLNSCWQSRRRLYFPLWTFWLAVALMAATKTAIAGIALLAVLIPLVNERNVLFRVTMTKVWLLATSMIVLVLFSLMFVLLDINLPSFERIQHFYEKSGIWRVILSGRDVMMRDVWLQYTASYDLGFWLFGASPAYFDSMMVKPIAEVDPFDLFVWFGPMGLLLMFGFNVWLIAASWRLCFSSRNAYAPALFVVNTLLLIVAILAGHIWTSGVLGIAFATYNGLLFYKSHADDSTEMVETIGA